MAQLTSDPFSIEKEMLLELEDGTFFQGHGFGAEKSVSGELVFQTGMVGYPESITDPSYRGQILVITYPLIGNYGVPSRETKDHLLDDLPAYFEAAEIHVTGLVVASYSGEDYSHHLAASSLGRWLKEQGVPAIQGVDTRALTKRIRREGTMLGKMLMGCKIKSNGMTNGYAESQKSLDHGASRDLRSSYDNIDWFDPNTKSLVADGKGFLHLTLAIS